MVKKDSKPSKRDDKVSATDQPNGVFSAYKNAACENCSPTSSSTVENIHINSIYIYNFPKDQEGGLNNSSFGTPSKSNFRSPASSGGPICRICHEGDNREDLVSPCRCTGSVGLVHKSCMERWLSTRCNPVDKCEICSYAFVTTRRPKSMLEWFRSDDNDGIHRRSLIGDLTCFSLLTPLAVCSSVLCIEGAKRQVSWGNSLEAGCLMALATFIITVYICWNILTTRYHLKAYYFWCERNQHVKLLRVQRISTEIDNATFEEDLEEVVVPAQGVAPNASPSVAIRMPDTI